MGKAKVVVTGPLIDAVPEYGSVVVTYDPVASGVMRTTVPGCEPEGTAIVLRTGAVIFPVPV